MASTAILISFIAFVSLLHSSSSVQICRLTRCSPTGPPIRFPFRIRNIQIDRCGFPDFDLSCNSKNETILDLADFGKFVVDRIDYDQQRLGIHDPQNCWPKRFLNFTSPNSTFDVIDSVMTPTFLNCSSNITASVPEIRTISCLSSENFVVTAVRSVRINETKSWPCRVITKARVPLPWSVIWYGLNDGFALTWRDPGCATCEARGLLCGFQRNSGMEIGCLNPTPTHHNGLPRTAKYGLIVGIGVPGLLCMIGFGCYICGKVKEHGHRRRRNVDYATSISPPSVVIRVGLDGHKIESFPKTVLGNSRRLPRPTDNTCPICLSEYQPRETLRTIPECNHYFHADCIDEWLLLNATCPLCRNSPDCSSVATTHSSSSLSSSSSTSNTHSSSSLSPRD